MNAAEMIVAFFGLSLTVILAGKSWTGFRFLVGIYLNRGPNVDVGSRLVKPMSNKEIEELFDPSLTWERTVRNYVRSKGYPKDLMEGLLALGFPKDALEMGAPPEKLQAPAPEPEPTPKPQPKPKTKPQPKPETKPQPEPEAIPARRLGRWTIPAEDLPRERWARERAQSRRAPRRDYRIYYLPYPPHTETAAETVRRANRYRP